MTRLAHTLSGLELLYLYDIWNLRLLKIQGTNFTLYDTLHSIMDNMTTI